MSITDPLRFLLVLFILSTIIQLLGCEPGPMNNYLREEPKRVVLDKPAYCQELSASQLKQQLPSVQKICSK